MKRFTASKKGLAGLAAVTGLVLTSGVAVAYFTSGGQGTGTATVGTSTAWAVTSDAATTANSLTPGGPTETITYHVKNNSTGAQHLKQVTIAVATSSGVSPAATSGVYSYPSPANTLPSCTKDDFQLGGTLTAGAVETQTKNAEIAAGATADYSVTVKMINRSDSAAGDGLGNQDNCKSQSPPLFFAAS